MPKLYTRKGDDGNTGLPGEERFPKYHPRIETLGTLDEATAALGLARALCKAARIPSILLEVQRDLYLIMSQIAGVTGKSQPLSLLDKARVDWLESQIDSITRTTPIPREFILPGDSPGEAALSLARTVVRRAERRLAALAGKDEIDHGFLQQYLNRLSSLCFGLELLENRSVHRKTSLAKK